MYRTGQALLFLLVSFMLAGCGLYRDKTVAELRSFYANEASRFVAVDGMEVHYRDEGRGPVLLLLHGSNASLHTWEGWVRELKSDYRLIRLDLPGHGLTGPHPENRYHWAEAAQFVDHFAQKLKLDRYVVVGNSMGGGIAWNYALAFPQKVEKLVLIGARGIPPKEPLPLAFRAYGWPGFNALLTVFTPRWMVAQSVREVYGDPDKVSEALIDRYFDLGLREGNRGATAYRMSHLDTYQATPRLAELKVPTLILWGEKDTWILPKYGHEFARRIPGAKLVLYPGLGHVPMEEAPEETAREVRAFLKSECEPLPDRSNDARLCYQDKRPTSGSR